MRAALGHQLESLTEKIIGAAFVVSNTLGHGFLETVYKNALMEELAVSGLRAVIEKSYPVFYREKIIGKYSADIVIEDTVIVELKAVYSLAEAHTAQVLNYLKASKLPIGLLFNFGTPRLQMKRILFRPSVEIR